MKTPVTDQELIKAIQERERMGAEALYDQYSVILIKIICCKVRYPVIAATVLEDTFLNIWTYMDSYQPENGRLLLWMTGMARALALSACPSTSFIYPEPAPVNNESVAMPSVANLLLDA